MTSHQCKYIDDRPTTDFSFGKFQMTISPQRIIRFSPCLVLRWGFLGSADRMALFRIGPNSIGRPYVRENNARGVIRLVAVSEVLFSCVTLK